MTLPPSLFLNATGQFLNPNLLSTSSSTILNFLTKATTADVSITSTGVYVDGPSVAQGTAGTWYAVGTLTLNCGSAANTFYVKLWDGSTIINTGAATTGAAGFATTVSLAGVLATPAGNLRLSATVAGAATSTIVFNRTGNSMDSNITAVRIG